MKKILFFSFVVFIATNILCENTLSNQNIYLKNKKINNKCKRPKNWDNIYVKKENCFMNTRHFLLYKNAVFVEPTIKRNIRNNITYCEIVNGSWFVKKNNDLNIEYSLENIHIDHIIPFDWLADQINCNDVNLVYNYILNLELADATYNKKKSNKICENKYICQRQKQICQKMNKDLNLSLKCNEL